MATDTRHSGTLRTDYEAGLARLDGFPAMETDRYVLLHRLIKAGGDTPYRDEDGREGILRPLLENQVLTVLADILRKNLSGYGDTFADVQGTARQADYAEKLKKDISQWISRLDSYLQNSWQRGSGDSPAAETARLLKERLEASLNPDDATEKDSYFRMLHAVTSIQRNAASYLQQAEESGDTDSALALLLACLKNYAGIAEAFNSRLAALPERYRRDILHAVPRPAVQDNVYAVITPKEGSGGFTIPEGQPFSAGQNAAGEDLVYQTTKEEYISPMQCEEVNAVSFPPSSREDASKPGIYTQPVQFQDVTFAETLFDEARAEDLAIGWQMESVMLVLREGERTVGIRFRLTEDSVMPPDIPSGSFTLQVSTADGWTEQEHTCRIENRMLCFEFMLAQDEASPTPCNEEMHGTVTEHPSLRILTGNTACPYTWAKELRFDAVEIRTEVSGIRNFTLYNELGGVDTSQPFSPFGIQAARGAWFLFGNEEMGLKPLQEVRLRGRWQKLPETEAEFNAIYKEYVAQAGNPVGTDSFLLATEYQKDGKWHPCPQEEQHLFVPDNREDRSLACAKVVFDFTSPHLPMQNMGIGSYEYSRDKDGFFRATLQAPSIGFGTEAYRKLFTEVMIHNSHCKEKERKPLPTEPAVPLLADVELSYSAVEETALSKPEDSSLRLSRITALPEPDRLSGGKDAGTVLPFLPTAPSDHLLYFAFSRAKGEQHVRMYLDLALPREKIPFYHPQPGKGVTLSWQYRDGTDWKDPGTTAVLAEETRGLTQSGFIEIKLPEKISDRQTDSRGRLWLRAAVKGDISACLAIRGVWTDCIRLAAGNGDGSPLPAGTIQKPDEADDRIEAVTQPLPGFGGRPAETESEAAARQSSRLGNRHRAVTIKDYEQLVLEHFPEVDKAQCIPVPREKGASEICLVVFSRAEDSRYCLSPAWKLAEIGRMVSRYAPPSVTLQVMNPVYETVKVHCKAVLWDKVQDEGKAIRQLVTLARDYIAPWYRQGGIPRLQQRFSYKELHARMANHEDLMKLVTLEVDGRSLPHVDIDTEDLVFAGSHPWSVLLPEVQIELLSPRDGINAAEIGSNFIIE